MQRSTKEDAADSLRWEWRLPGGEKVTATIDATAGTESVFLDGHLVSSTPRGTKPDGHIVPAQRAADEAGQAVVVTFDPRVAICILRIGREEVAPAQWPQPQRSKGLAPPSRSFPLGSLLAVVLLAVAIAGVVELVKRLRASSSESDATIAGVHRAENGLFMAHFPASFTARLAVVPGAMSGVVLEDRNRRSEAVVIVAQPTEDGLRDPWAMQKQAHGEALANLPRGGGAHLETGRGDGTCLGQPGAVVLGRVATTRGEPATVWSCAFFRGTDAYLVMYMVGESASAEAAARLRKVVDATELTRLGPMTSAPP